MSSVAGSFLVSRQKDNYIQNRHDWLPHWHVYLSNKEEIFDDDGRKDHDGSVLPSSWFRLKEYCESKQIWIDRMYLRFKSHYEHIPKADAYFFKKGALGSIGMKTRDYFIIGTVNQDKIYIKKWKTPELIIEEEDIRNLQDNLDWVIAGGKNYYT